MANIIIRPGWHIPERLVTPESAYVNRRQFLRKMGFAGGLLATGLAEDAFGAEAKKGYPYPRTKKFDPGWALTSERVAAGYNNFYEFSTDKERVSQIVGPFPIVPWPLEITGLCDNPMKLDLEELVEMMPLEERVYRFRCVEAWAMVVPWTGFPLSKLIEKAKPKADAKFLQFTTALKPDFMPGVQRIRSYPWPYTEGLRMDEAMNELTLGTIGIYGKRLPKQHGSPFRLVVPWKYGYKSIKSIVKIEFTAQQPKTFWETLAADEYPFESNVDPKVPHPRWSQATERMIDTGDRVRTQQYNGYGDYVAKLYA